MSEECKSLDLKYRPSTLEDMVGNQSTLKSLKCMLEREVGIPKTFLFTGPSGCGKTTLAHILRNILKVHDKDFMYYNTSNTRGIDTIRGLETSCRYKPLGGKIKLYLLDECHMLTKEAQNALLLLLEDPPTHVYFALCTTNPEKLLETIKTRCCTYPVTSLSRNKISFLLKRVCKEEGLDPPLPDKVLNEIASASQGSSRKALKILDQIIDIDDDEEAFKAVQDASVSESSVLDICRLLVQDTSEDKWKEARTMVQNINAEPESIRYAILGYLATTLLKSERNDRIAEIISVFSEPVMYSGKGGIVLEIYLACKL